MSEGGFVASVILSVWKHVFYNNYSIENTIPTECVVNPM